MYQAAICDDEITEVKRLFQYLSGWQRRHPVHSLEIEGFTDVQELLIRFKESGYKPDVLFLDIYMQEASGITVAKELREMRYDGAIVFITASQEHALEAFGVNAFQYLVKPVRSQALSLVLDKLFKNGEDKKKDCILLRIEGRVCRVSVDDIVYCEAQGKNQCLHLSRGVRQQLRMSMMEIYGMLEERKKFARVGASYIVNLEHVVSIDGQKICMDNDENIFLPRGAYHPLREQYFQYYCEDE